MSKIVVEAKTIEEALDKIVKENKLNKEDILYSTEELKGKLFKSSTVKVSAITKEEIMNEIKTFITLIGKNMGIEITFENNIRENQFNVKMFSNNNPILIGKNGQTMKAIETIVKQKVLNDHNIRIKLFLDVENYNEKRIKHLERLAINTAKEVRDTKVEAILDNMNSYERRIIHNVLTDFKGISTISEGEEPNRHVIIKPI